MSLLCFTCTYYYVKNKSSDIKLNFTKEATSRRRYLEFIFSRVGTVKVELEDLVKYIYDKKENVLKLVLVAKINQEQDGQTTRRIDQVNFLKFVYDQLMSKSANQKMENTLDRISSVFTFVRQIADNQLEFEFKAEVTGNWETYSKRFNEIVGSFSKVEDKPILYEIGKEFFFDMRDATASLNGYLYQVDLALSYWIDTLDNPKNCVMIEFGEDIALLPIKFVNEIENFKINIKNDEGQSNKNEKNVLVFDQAKLYKEMIPFNSDCICDIFLNYFTTEGRSGDSETTTVTYRFTTSTTIENLQVWNEKGDGAVKMFKEMVEQHDKKRSTNSTKIRYKRESEDWQTFVNYCRQDWKKAVERVSKVEFIETITPEKLSEIIETKLKRHLGKKTNCNITRLRNQLFGMIKSQLLENRGNESNPKMLHPQKLRKVIDEEIQACNLNQQLQKENEDLRSEIEKLKKQLN